MAGKDKRVLTTPDGQLLSFDDFVNRYWLPLSRIAHRFLGGRDRGEDPQDLVQDALIKLWQVPKLPDKPLAWLRVALKRLAINVGRRTTRRATLTGIEGEHETASGRTPASSPAERAESRERAALVRAGMNRLEAKDLMAIQLRYLDELTPREVAEILGLSKDAESTRAHRAREKLRGILFPVGGENAM